MYELNSPMQLCNDFWNNSLQEMIAMISLIIVLSTGFNHFSESL